LLCRKVARLAEHRLAALEKEVINERNRLQMDITNWRHDQLHLMPGSAERITNHEIGEPEMEILFLPSDFPLAVRESLGFHHLGEVEMLLREGEAYDALRDLRSAVKHINGLSYEKRSSVRNSGPNTRTKQLIDDAKSKCDNWIEKYTAARQAMINLGCTRVEENDEFPKLTAADAVMKYTELPHALGDGSKSTGPLWRAGGRKKLTLSSTSLSPVCLPAVSHLLTHCAARYTISRTIYNHFQQLRSTITSKEG
jgi:hypothetical protein